MEIRDLGNIATELAAKNRVEYEELKGDVKSLKAYQERLENVERMASEMKKMLIAAQSEIKTEKSFDVRQYKAYDILKSIEKPQRSYRLGLKCNVYLRLV